MKSTKELLYVFKTNTENKMLHTYNFTLTSFDKETLKVLFQMTWGGCCCTPLQLDVTTFGKCYSHKSSGNGVSNRCATRLLCAHMDTHTHT